MKLPLYQVDAFTSRAFRGNPAAVVLLDDWLPDDMLAAIAAENNLAETAFVVARGDVMPLRWFTPTMEVDLCGHATLAAAHVLFRHSIPSAKRVTFSTRSGNLVVERDGELLSMDFPSRPGKPMQVSDAVDYVYRFLAPRQGIPEDPATGSANCTLVPYWAARLGKAELVAKQLSARGGDLRCTLRGERVLIAGRVAEYLRGEITVEA